MRKYLFLFAVLLCGCSAAEKTAKTTLVAPTTRIIIEDNSKYHVFNNFVYQVVDSEITLIHYLDIDPFFEVIIPEYINKLPVTIIGDGCFEYAKIKSVVIPETVKEIRSGAFFGCLNLKEVKISKSATIGEQSFSGTPFLNESKEEFVVINDVLAHYNNTGQKTLTIPNTVRKIDEGVFFDNPHLEEITFPESVEDLGDDNFLGMPNLKLIRCKVNSPAHERFMDRRNIEFEFINN